MSTRKPAPALPSATIVVIREIDSGPEVLLVRRRAGDAFGDSYAFPGGVIDENESNAHIVCEGLSPAEANQVLGTNNGLDYYSAAIRELFEETGILLARNNEGNWIKTDSNLSKQRYALNAGKLGWTEFLQKRKLCMAGDCLHYFAYWETPYIQPKRWKTRFFISQLPDGQSAMHDGAEITDSRWLTPKNALELFEDGSLPMPMPTVHNVRDFAKFETFKEILNWANQKSSLGIKKIRPAMGIINGKPRALVPGDVGYEEADSKWLKT